MLTKKKKDLLIEFNNFCCENCHKHQDEVGKLEIHHINPLDEGGSDSHRNLKVLCENCHEIFSSAQRMARGISK